MPSPERGLGPLVAPIDEAPAGRGVAAAPSLVSIARVVKLRTEPGAWLRGGLFAMAVVLVLHQARSLLEPMAVAVVLAFVLSPMVRALRRVGVPEAAGAAMLVVALVGSVALALLSLSQPAALWWQRAPSTVAQLMAYVDRLRTALPFAFPPLPTGAAGPAAAAASDPLKERLASEGVAFTGVLLGHGAAFALAATATLVLLYLLLISERWMIVQCLEAMPRRRMRALVLGGLRAAQREISQYLVVVGIINIAVGTLTGLAVHALGLPNPTLWGALVAVLSFVPYLGPMVIGLLLLMAGALTFPTFGEMVAPPLAFFAIHAVESTLISPWIVGRRLALSGIAIVLSVWFWGWLWGVTGALIAVPVLIGVRSLCRRQPRLRILCGFLDGPRRPPRSLRSLLEPKMRPRPRARNL